MYLKFWYYKTNIAYNSGIQKLKFNVVQQIYRIVKLLQFICFIILKNLLKIFL